MLLRQPHRQVLLCPAPRRRGSRCLTRRAEAAREQLDASYDAQV